MILTSLILTFATGLLTASFVLHRRMLVPKPRVVQRPMRNLRPLRPLPMGSVNGPPKTPAKKAP